MHKDHRIPSVEVHYANYSSFTKPFKTKVHEIDYYYIHLHTQGYCQVLIQGELITVGPGDLLIYQPGETFFLGVEPVHLKSNGYDISSEYYNIGCAGDWVEQWHNTSSPPQKIKIPMNRNILNIFDTLALERRQIIEVREMIEAEESKKEVYDYLLRSLFIFIDRTIQRSSSNQLNTDAYLMKDYIERKAADVIKLDDVARHAGLSVSRSVHLFKLVFNKTIMQYALEIRLSMACERIKFSTTTLEQIAESCGFGSYSYFHRVFKAKYKMSPKQFRNM